MANVIEIITERGTRSAIGTIQRLKHATEFGVQKGLFQAGKDIHKEFNTQVKAKNKTGRIYKYKGRRIRASAAGETPANRSGHYRKSFGFHVNGSSELTIGNAAEYADDLEEGTSRMKPRTGLRNSIRAQERNILNNLGDGILSEL